MITLHGEEVKVEDKVWHISLGWGEVVDLKDNVTARAICAKWKEGYEWFTEDGKIYANRENPILFWQPIEFEIPKKPKQKEKAWQWICRDASGNYWLTYLHHADWEAVLEFFPNTEPIEPYLPSEIEREV